MVIHNIYRYFYFKMLTKVNFYAQYIGPVTAIVQRFQVVSNFFNNFFLFYNFVVSLTITLYSKLSEKEYQLYLKVVEREQKATNEI